MLLITKIQKFLLETNWYVFILSGVFIVLGLNLLITSLPFSQSITNLKEIQALKELNPFFALLLLVVLTPILETILFQYLPISAILYFFKNSRYKKVISVLFSAFLFGIAHSYNLTYIILGFITGIVFAIFFLLSAQRNKLPPSFNIFIIHLLLNFIPYFIDFILIHF